MEKLYRKGQGMANLELNVPIEPNMIFHLGSVAKVGDIRWLTIVLADAP